jgi:hypothetical protein
MAIPTGIRTNSKVTRAILILIAYSSLVFNFVPVKRYLVSENASLFPQKTAIKLILASHLMAVAPSPFIIVWVRKTRMPPTP